jgi:hypothetical protein
MLGDPKSHGLGSPEASGLARTVYILSEGPHAVYSWTESLANGGSKVLN